MLRSILLVLDQSPSSMVARDLAIRAAIRFDAHLSALAVLDRSHITAPHATGIGGIAFKRHLDDVKLSEAREVIEVLEEECREVGRKAGIAIELLEREGTPYKLIEQAAIRHDIIVTGRDADCHYDFEANPADTVQQLLIDNPRPIVVCPDDLPAEGGPLLAAFDGSSGASRALHMLALLGFAGGRTVHVLTIDEDEATARFLASRAAMILAQHGAEATAHGLVSDGDEADAILAQLDALGASGLVMGAFGGNRLRDWLLGSTTRTIVNTCPVPLFVYH